MCYSPNNYPTCFTKEMVHSGTGFFVILHHFCIEYVYTYSWLPYHIHISRQKVGGKSCYICKSLQIEGVMSFLGCQYMPYLEAPRPVPLIPITTHRQMPLSSYYTVRKHHHVLGHNISWCGKLDVMWEIWEMVAILRSSHTEEQWPP